MRFSVALGTCIEGTSSLGCCKIGDFATLSAPLLLAGCIPPVCPEGQLLCEAVHRVLASRADFW